MEKLQRALQKARQQRVGQPPARAAGSGRGTVSNERVDALWADLTPFEPSSKQLLRNRVVSYRPGRDASAVDILRTKTLLHMRKQNWKRLAITSATSGCGKTTTLCNIAIGITRQPDVRAILFDLDLRRPSIAKVLDAKPVHEVTDMLTGKIGFEDQALRIRSNLAVCLALQPAADPMRYLMSRQTQETLKDIERRYKPDLMLFDLPPMKIDADTPGFLGNVDCALIMARASKTTVSELDKCEREVAEHTNVMGVILNQYRHGEGTSGYSEYSE
ncbi:MAG: tyrosine-protein kinase family protein [Paracoccaceae bacterium]